MINASCINAKAPIQKQGEYSSGHSCKYCSIVESVIYCIANFVYQKPTGE
uniref:Uncharacterized protein n=1 Tax=Arundo donax TaxID=35708 RepID=A0A0A8ZMY4_ARUDO